MKDEHEYLELEYAQSGPVIVEGEDGHYSFLSNEDLILSTATAEETAREVALDKLRVKAVDNAENYYQARCEDKASLWGPVYILTAYFLGLASMGLIWYLRVNEYLGPAVAPW